MKHDKAIQLPLSVEGQNKRLSRSQFAAMCYRIHDDKVQVLLVTSRRSKRWILPKGWPEWGITPAQSAAKEAYEEGGVRGTTQDTPLGVYSYTKVRGEDDLLPCVVMVYPLRVKKVLQDFPEAKERRRKWFTRKKAASLVHEPELKRLIRTFDPRPKRR